MINSEPAPAFGIDLAGYSTGKSVCAVAEDDRSRIRVTILVGCPFSEVQRTTNTLEPILSREVQFLKSLLDQGPVAVDVPIDLRALSPRRGAGHIWELTLRPIDRALGALPALADRIGAATARFQKILHIGQFRDSLGRRLFETYPAGSLRSLKLAHRGYKGKASSALAKRKALASALNMRQCELSDDELDAAICAVTALPNYRLMGHDLANRLDLSPRSLPAGYILLGKLPAVAVTVAREHVSRWLQ